MQYKKDAWTWIKNLQQNLVNEDRDQLQRRFSHRQTHLDALNASVAPGTAVSIEAPFEALKNGVVQTASIPACGGMIW